MEERLSKTSTASNQNGVATAAATSDSQAAPALVTISLPVDAAVVAWFKGKLQPADWRHHMAEMLQFYMETNQPRPGVALAGRALRACRLPEPAKRFPPCGDDR